MQAVECRYIIVIVTTFEGSNLVLLSVAMGQTSPPRHRGQLANESNDSPRHRVRKYTTTACESCRKRRVKVNFVRLIDRASLIRVVRRAKA